MLIDSAHTMPTKVLAEPGGTIADELFCPILTMCAGHWATATRAFKHPLHIIEISDPAPAIEPAVPAGAALVTGR